MNRIIFLFLFIAGQFFLNGQDVTLCKVVNAVDDQPVPFAMVRNDQSGRYQLTNSDGKLQLDGIGTSFTILHPGYNNVTFVTTTDQVVSLTPVVRPGIPQEEVESILKDVFSGIEDQYPRDDHLLTFFYQENINDNQGQTYGYGEGRFKTLKKEYRDRPKDSDNRKSRDSERQYPERSFYEDQLNAGRTVRDSLFIPFEKVMQPIVLPTLIDFLRSPISVLEREVIKKYRYRWVGVTTFDNKPVYRIAFEPKDNEGILKGEMLIAADDKALVEVSYMILPQYLDQIFGRNNGYAMIGKMDKITYARRSGKYTLTKMEVTNIYHNLRGRDTLSHNVVLVTTEVALDDYDKPRPISSAEYEENNLVILPTGFEPFWKTGEMGLARTDKIQALIDAKRKERMILGRAGKVTFIEDDYKDVLKEAIKEKKLILGYFYSNFDPACKKMEALTLRHPHLVQLLEKEYLPYRVDVEDEFEHDLYPYFTSETLPSIAVVTPLGQVIGTYYGFMDPESITDSLARINDAVSVDSLLLAFHSQPGNKEIALAKSDLVLFRMLKRKNITDYKRHLQNYMDVIKDWSEPEVMDIVFNSIGVYDREDYIQYFWDHQERFREKYGKAAYYRKIYQLAYNHAQVENDKKYFYISAYEWAPEVADSLQSAFNIEYYEHFDPNPEQRAMAILDHYSAYPDIPWKNARSQLLRGILSLDDKKYMQAFLNVLFRYQGEAPQYEVMDLQSIIYYKMGETEKALSMASEVVKLAMDNGIRYKSSLSLLRE